MIEIEPRLEDLILTIHQQLLPTDDEKAIFKKRIDTALLVHPGIHDKIWLQFLSWLLRKCGGILDSEESTDVIGRCSISFLEGACLDYETPKELLQDLTRISITYLQKLAKKEEGLLPLTPGVKDYCKKMSKITALQLAADIGRSLEHFTGTDNYNLLCCAIDMAEFKGLSTDEPMEQGRRMMLHAIADKVIDLLTEKIKVKQLS